MTTERTATEEEWTALVQSTHPRSMARRVLEDGVVAVEVNGERLRCPQRLRRVGEIEPIHGPLMLRPGRGAPS